MEAAVSKLFELLVTLGIGILVVLGAGFWLFHALKNDAEARERDRTDDSAAPRGSPTEETRGETGTRG